MKSESFLSAKLIYLIESLPRSPLWGMQILMRYLKLLIELGHHNEAVQLFSKSQLNLVRFELRKVKVTGDAMAFIQELSYVFFGIVRDSCRKYTWLFTANGDNCESFEHSALSHFLSWTKVQIEIFVTDVSRQLQLLVTEQCTLSMDVLRTQAAHRIEDLENYPFLYPSETHGPLGMVALCINEIFGIAMNTSLSPLDVMETHHNSEKSHAYNMLAFLLVPELRKIIEIFVESLVTETNNQIGRYIVVTKIHCYPTLSNISVHE